MYEVIVAHGSDKHKISFDSPHPTSMELSEKLENLTGIIPSKQKLIHKGKKLGIDTKSLSDLGICSGNKIMLLGSKVNPKDDEICKRILKVKSDVEKIKENVVDQDKQLKGIQEGYLPEEFRTEALSKIHKQCIGSVEQLMKLLELLDSIQPPSENIRSMKKNQVAFVQSVLDDCDRLMERL